jgi:hypothetical protein
MIRLLPSCLFLVALLGACSDEAGGEDEICSNETIVDDIDDGVPADAATGAN